MDKRDDIIDKVRRYRQLVADSKLPVDIEQVYLFGSYAKGQPHKDSDIDVAFITENTDNKAFDAIFLLWKLRRQIDVRIEPHLLSRDSDYSDFIAEVQRTGIQVG
jgi:predicted nucleotidyltransferase